LEDVFDSTLKALREARESSGRAVMISAPQPTTLGAHRALQAEIRSPAGQGKGGKVSLRTWTVIAGSEDYWWFLEYTGFGDGYERNFPALEKTRRSLVLK
jgi:hypothetical protein